MWVLRKKKKNEHVVAWPKESKKKNILKKNGLSKLISQEQQRKAIHVEHQSITLAQMEANVGIYISCP